MKIVHIQQEQLPERIPIADSFAGDGYRQGPGGQLPDVDIDFQSDRRQEVKGIWSGGTTPTGDSRSSPPVRSRPSK